MSDAPNTSDPHPSFLALDRIALGGANAEPLAHAKSCPRCAAHLQTLAAPLEVPRWVRALEAEPRKSPRRASRWAFGFALACASAAVFALVIRPAPTASEAGAPEAGVKGAPSIALYVKRGERISLWDGRAELQAGDGIRLKVAAAGYSHVSVEALTGGSLVEVFSGEVRESGETAIPASWSLDGAPGPERILLVFSKAPLAKSELQLAAQKKPRTDLLWSTVLDLPKRSAP